MLTVERLSAALAFRAELRRGERDEVVVVGAGAAGLAAAAMLKERGIGSLVLERADRVGSSWRARYDSLILNTPRITSTLAGYRMPRRYGRWPTRDDIVEYLEEYGRRQGLRIEFGVELQRLERRDGSWALETSKGEIRAFEVVIATGHERQPLIPDWPGRNEFPGPLIHSAEYRNAESFRGQDILVVSASNSGTEIAYELASNAAARVVTSMRTPPPVSPASGRRACRSTTPPACSRFCPIVPLTGSPVGFSG
jgi:cation diffusion facilitator CzcD-associated flavoprotein CzcO